MRILLVHQPVDAGVGRHVLDLYLGLRERGHDVLLCGPELPAASRTSASPARREDHRPLPMVRQVAPGQDRAAVRGLAEIITRLEPDLVHAHSSKGGAIARIAHLSRRSPPVLYSPHGFAFAGFFQSRAERTAYREVERGLALLTQRIVTCCQAEAELAAAIAPMRKIRVVHNGIAVTDPGPADDRVVALAARGPVICSITQLRPGKGAETLIEAAAIVHRSRPDAQFAIVGGGPLDEPLRARVAALGVSENVHFLGEHPQPLCALAASQIFALTSWAEAFPYVILEAMASGLPIVSSDVGGVREAISDESSGLIVPVQAPEPTAEAILRLLDEPAFAASLGERARSRQSSQFTRSTMVDGMQAVYAELLG